MSTSLDGRGKLKASPALIAELSEAGFECDENHSFSIDDGGRLNLELVESMADTRAAEIEEVDCRFENHGDAWRLVKDEGVVYQIDIVKVALLPRHKKLLIGLLEGLPEKDGWEIRRELELFEPEDG